MMAGVFYRDVKTVVSCGCTVQVVAVSCVCLAIHRSASPSIVTICDKNAKQVGGWLEALLLCSIPPLIDSII